VLRKMPFPLQLTDIVLWFESNPFDHVFVFVQQMNSNFALKLSITWRNRASSYLYLFLKVLVA
jgi:hypothetical protein